MKSIKHYEKYYRLRPFKIVKMEKHARQRKKRIVKIHASQLISDVIS